MLELINLTKKYGDFTALDHLNASFDTGMYGLLGPNGAGKSTMLNLITDNIKRTEGSILYNGKDILTMGSAYRKKIGYTPQMQGMYDDFTARDFLHYIGSLKGMKSARCKKQTEEFLGVVNLSKDAHHKLGSFSGGMKQRVLLAAAMLDDPEILILDEPTAGLDPAERIRLRNYIASLGENRTVILSTHVLGDIESIAKKVLLLSHGKLRHFEAPNQLIEQVKRELADRGDVETDNMTLEDIYLYYTEHSKADGEQEHEGSKENIH